MILSGTAAMGTPVANSLVTVVDLNGGFTTVLTSGTGTYSADLSGMTAPFLVQLDLPGGGVLFSTATSAGTANIHPYSDAIVELFYRVQGLDAATEFASPAPSTIPNSTQLQILSDFVEDTIRIWMENEGLDPDIYELITSPLVANGSGFDALLDKSTVTDNGTLINVSIDDGAGTTQTTDFTADDTNSEVFSNSTLISPSGTTNSSSSTIVPTTPNQQSAVDAVIALMEQFEDEVNSRGSLLADTHLLQFTTTDLLDEGRDRTWFAGELADELRGTTLVFVGIDTIHGYDSSNMILDATVDLTVTEGSVTQNEQVRLSFKKVSTDWLIFGNRRLGDVGVQVEHRIDMTAGGTTAMKSINVDVRAPVGVIQSVTIDDGTVFINAPVPKASQTELVEFDHAPGQTTQKFRDTFFLNSGALGSYPAPGTVFTVTVTPVTGPVEVYEIISGGTTTEQTTVTSPTGHTLGDLMIGSTLTATWTLPSTFSVTEQDASVNLVSASFARIVDANDLIGSSTTTADFALPADLNGETILSATLNVSHEGPSGERILILFQFD